jgi:hypothetical protein
MIVDLLKLKGISVSADLDGIREALELCAKQRDALAHGLWIKDQDYPDKPFLRILSGIGPRQEDGENTSAVFILRHLNIGTMKPQACLISSTQLRNGFTILSRRYRLR